MNGISVVVAQLVYDLSDLVMFSFYCSISDDLLEPIPEDHKVSKILNATAQAMVELHILKSTLLPLIVELVIQQALNGLVHFETRVTIPQSSLTRNLSFHDCRSCLYILQTLVERPEVKREVQMQAQSNCD